MTENISAVGCKGRGVGRDYERALGDNGDICCPGTVSQVPTRDRTPRIVCFEYTRFIMYQLSLTKAKSIGFVGTRENVLSWRGSCLRE